MSTPNPEHIALTIFVVLFCLLLCALCFLIRRNSELFEELREAKLRESSYKDDSEEAWEKYREAKATEVWFNRYHNLRSDLLHVLSKTGEVTYNETVLEDHARLKETPL